MFTGIIERIAILNAIKQNSADLSLTFNWKNLPTNVIKNGDSIAVNGCCLTVVGFNSKGFTVDLSPETLALTTFKDMQLNTVVNIEFAATLNTVLGGHLVSGHIDGIANVTNIQMQGKHHIVELKVAKDLSKYITKKGSICIDGISLTVNGVNNNTFYVNIIPYTFAQTIMHTYKIGTKVHIEIDLIARYVARMLQYENSFSHVENI